MLPLGIYQGSPLRRIQEEEEEEEWNFQERGCGALKRSLCQTY